MTRTDIHDSSHFRELSCDFASIDTTSRRVVAGGEKALKMLKMFYGEVREVIWLASVVGGLSVAGVSLAIAAVVALERLSVVAL